MIPAADFFKKIFSFVFLFHVFFSFLKYSHLYFCFLSKNGFTGNNKSIQEHSVSLRYITFSAMDRHQRRTERRFTRVIEQLEALLRNRGVS